MDYIKKYPQKKEKDLAKVSILNDQFVILYKRFDPETGEELSNEICLLNIDALKERKKEIEFELESLNLILKEVEELKNKIEEEKNEKNKQKKYQEKY